MEPNSLYSLDKLKSLSNGDDAFVHKMLTMFIQYIPESIEVMVEAAAKKDWYQISQTAHKIKTSIDMLGISTVYQKLRDLENWGRSGKELAQIPLVLSEVILILNKVVQSIKQALIVGV